MRSAKETNNFPYIGRNMCYFSVDHTGKVEQLPTVRKYERPILLESFKNAKQGKIKIYAVWPGNYTSDLFVIDDLEKFAVAFEFVNE